MANWCLTFLLLRSAQAIIDLAPPDSDVTILINNDVNGMIGRLFITLVSYSKLMRQNRGRKPI